MKAFAALYDAIDATTSTSTKVREMVAYLRGADPRDAAWAIFVLSGRRFKRLISARLLLTWAAREAELPTWAADECYHVVGDLAETVALILPRSAEPSDDALLFSWMEERLPGLRGLSAPEQRELIVRWWRGLSELEVYVVCKLITGALRVGVSATLVRRAAAEAFNVPTEVVARRLMGDWKPSAEFIASLGAPVGGAGASAFAGEECRPYPFFLASPITPPTEPGEQRAWLDAQLGTPSDWLVEWKWDGIRAQLIRRSGRTELWSRTGESLTERFPEIIDAARALAEAVVIDGELLAFRDGRALPFAVLQRRIQRFDLTSGVLTKAPAAFMAYDLLEHSGIDLRSEPLMRRRELLHTVIAAAGVSRLVISERVNGTTWAEFAAARATSRSRGVEGVMLKRLDSSYAAGRVRGDWWKWKIDPLSVDAVLVYAEPGHGRRANLLTDYTFAVWSSPGDMRDRAARGSDFGGLFDATTSAADGDLAARELVPFAKAYSGLNNEEIRELDNWLRRHTTERFGPVRAVEPVRVFELAFEGIAASPRHRSGVAVRFPRILRPRPDKPASEADTLARLWEMIDHGR